MPEEEPSRSPGPAAPGKRPPVRRSRRGGRGRGRGRKPASVAAPQSATESRPASEVAEPAFAEERLETAEPALEEMPIADSPIEEARHEAAEESFREEHEHRQEREHEGQEHPRESPARPYSERTERRDFRPAPPAAIADAIAEVNQIITSLKQVLDQMEEVLETLELAEVQKTADEREIESLRYGLRQVERRGGEPRHESHSHHAPPLPRHEPRRGRR